MPSDRRLPAILAAAMLAAGVHAARADEAAALTHEILTLDDAGRTAGSGSVAGRIAADFQSFAGSNKNATALVTGLREGSQITLTRRGFPSATFTPPTRPMGYGNVSTSLALAKYQLAQQGIVNPTPEQLRIALNGGTIVYGGKTVAYDGILQMRADGLGWGEIAQQLGTKLGPVVSSIRSQNAGIAASHRALPSGRAATTTPLVPPAQNARAAGRAADHGKGIVNAGSGTAQGIARGKTDVGASAAAGPAQPHGRGIVSASGQPVGAGAAQGTARAPTGAATAAGAVAGGAGAGASGQGKALGHSK